MKYTLIIIAILILGIALRTTQQKWLRKLGVLFYMVATGLAGYFIFDSITTSLIFILFWFLFPWLELLLSVRKTKLPLENKLRRESLPNKEFFPESPRIKDAFEADGYVHITDCGWKWADSHEHYSLFWHPEQKHVAAICHRIQSCVTFCYLNITSTTEDGQIWRSSNFPFSTSLPPSPQTQFNHIKEGNISCPRHVLYLHELFLYDKGIDNENLKENDLENIEQIFEHEMRKQIDHNLKSGHIQLTGDGHYKYSFKGLFYLWRQILKDMFRLC